MPEGDDFDHAFDELLEDRFLLGSPGEVADQLNRLNHRLGVTALVASIPFARNANASRLNSCTSSPKRSVHCSALTLDRVTREGNQNA